MSVIKQRLRGLLKQPTIMQRLILIAMGVNALAIFMLIGAQRYQNEAHFYSNSAETLPTQLAFIGRELESEMGVIAAPALAQQEEFKMGTNLFVVCGDDLTTLFSSKALKALNISNICGTYGDLSPEEFAPQQLSDGRPYYLYPMRFLTLQGERTVIVLRDATEALAELKTLNKQTTIKLLVILLLVMVMMVSASAWSLKPVKILLAQLNEIIRGERESLSEPKARELRRITDAINEMLDQGKTRKATYQNAMKDLAHSLKTRLAATHAIVDEHIGSDDEARKALYEQLGQMDELIQYQLRKATMGREGLSRQQVAIGPLVSQISQMLDKVYPDKSIHCELDLNPKLKFPGGKDDLMELSGNLMENAYRFAQTRVRIGSRFTADGDCELLVEDDGPGIAQEVRQRVLKRGERADERHSGQGIGLAVCHEIAHAYRGSLTIEQSDLGGARLRLVFPIQKNRHNS